MGWPRRQPDASTSLCLKGGPNLGPGSSLHPASAVQHWEKDCLPPLQLPCACCHTWLVTVSLELVVLSSDANMEAVSNPLV